MSSFVNYVIEAALSLGIFTFIYWFILRGENRFEATRFYLLLALLFSTLLPFITIRINFFGVLAENRVSENLLASTNLLQTVTVFASGIPAKLSQAILTFNLTLLVYMLGALAAFFVMVTGFIRLMQMISKNRVFRLKQIRLVVSANDLSPYSFFNYIFIGKNLTEQKNWKTMVHHELEHVKQGHSFDVLFVDFMMIFQWFNPFYWILRRLVRENHEFLADSRVLAKGVITGGSYKALLLSQAIGGHPVMTSNFLNVKSIKKRFKMITKNKTTKYGFLKYSFGILFALALTLLFACEEFDRNSFKKSDSNFIYNGQLSSFDEVSKMGVKNLQIIEADQLDVLMIYPEMKPDLKEQKYQLAFNVDDKGQMKLYSKLEIKNHDIQSNKVNELDVVGYGTGKQLETNEEVFTIVEVMPEFPGGAIALRQTLGKIVVYPAEAAKQGIQGKVFVMFVVGSDGMVKNATIARGVHPLLDAEALRVINQLPKWAPGTQKGVPVAVSYTVPISFQLQ